MDDIIFEAVRHCDTDPISLTGVLTLDGSFLCVLSFCDLILCALDSNIAHMDSFDFNSQQSPPRYSSSSGG